MRKIFTLIILLSTLGLFAQPTSVALRPIPNKNYMSSATEFNADVTFFGTVNPIGVISQVYFEYWPDNGGIALMGTVAAQPFLVEGNLPIQVFADQLLTQGMVLDPIVRGNYNVRMKIVNGNGTFYSSNTFNFNPIFNLAEKILVERPCNNSPTEATIRITNNFMHALSITTNDGTNELTQTINDSESKNFTCNNNIMVAVYINYPNPEGTQTFPYHYISVITNNSTCDQPPALQDKILCYNLGLKDDYKLNGVLQPMQNVFKFVNNNVVNVEIIIVANEQQTSVIVPKNSCKYRYIAYPTSSSADIYFSNSKIASFSPAAHYYRDNDYACYFKQNSFFIDAAAQTLLVPYSVLLNTKLSYKDQEFGIPQWITSTADIPNPIIYQIAANITGQTRTAIVILMLPIGLDNDQHIIYEEKTITITQSAYTVPKSGLTMHLSSDNEVLSETGKVNHWNDVSGNNNHAVQNTSANCPSVVTGGAGIYPAIRFNGSNSSLNLPTTGALGIQNSAYDVYIVANSQNTTSQTLLSSATSGHFEYLLNQEVGARYTPKPGFNLDRGAINHFSNWAFHVLSANASATGGSIKVDGFQGSAPNNDLRSGEAVNLLLGTKGDGTLPLDGDILEVLIYNRQLDVTEGTNLDKYLAERYGIIFPIPPVLSEIETSTLSYSIPNTNLNISNSITIISLKDIVKAVIQISENYQSSEDQLIFSNQNGITGSWDNATGTLTLSGSATLAQYQTALRSIAYKNTGGMSVLLKTISFTIWHTTLYSNTLSHKLNVSTEPGNALNFDGTDDYVAIPDNDANISSAVTLETWVLYTEDGLKFICSKGAGHLEIHTNTGGDLRFIPTELVFIDATAALPLNTWTHIAFVYDPAQLLAKIYINGEEVPVVNNGTNPLSTLIVGNANDFWIGRRTDSSYPFKGNIDEMRIWNVARTQQEISDNFAKPLADYASQSNLVSYYNFNQGVAGSDNTTITELTDLKVNFNGTLTNFTLTGSTSNWVASYAMVVPKAIDASSLTENGFTANWEDPEVGNFDNYLLYVATDESFATPVAGYNPKELSNSVNAETITGLLLADNTYYYKLVAQNNSFIGQAAASNTILANDMLLISANVFPVNSGSVTGAGFYTSATTAELVATPEAGCYFVNWTENGIEVSIDATYSFTVIENRTLVGNFVLQTFDISASVNPLNSGSIAGIGNYTIGATAELIATPETGYNFVNWTEGGSEVSTTATYSFAVTANRTLIANFVLQPFEIAASVSPVSSGTITGTGTFDYGTTAELIATPETGYNFVNWTESGIEVSTSATYSFTVMENRTLLANFVLQTFDISASVNPLNSGSIAGIGNYTIGATAELIATPETGYNFVNWTEGGSEVSTTATYSFAVTANRTLIANFVLQPFEIAASVSPASSGTITGTGTFDYGTTAELIATPETGYNFVNWTEGGTPVSTDATYSFIVSENRTLVANFALQTFEIAASVSPVSSGTITGTGTFDYGTTAELIATPETGYNFVNWMENGTPVSTDATYSFIVSENRTLVANFVLQTFEISASVIPVSSGTISGAGTYDYGTTAELIATPATGYNFVNWTEDGTEVSTTATYSFTVGENRTLVANFVLQTFDISASAYPVNSGTISGAGNYTIGTTAELIATPETGYDFANWMENGTPVSTDATYSFIVSENRTLIANFVLQTFDISASVNPANSGTISGDGTYDYGTTAVLIATSATNYNFANWMENGTPVSTDATYSFIVSENRTLVANFVLQTFDISASVNPVNSGTIAGAGIFDYGTTAELIATPETGYDFVNWTEDGTEVSTTATYSFTVSENRTLIAHFVLQTFDISASVNPANSGTISGDGTYDYGTTAELIATSATGYDFANWTEGGTPVSTDATYFFIVSENRTLAANFVLQTFEISASVIPVNSGTISGAGTYDYGTTAELIATPATGYNFVNWTEDGTEVSTTATYSFTVGENRTLVANFEIQTFTILVFASDNTVGSVSGGGIFDFNQSVNVTATPAAGYSFTNWTENGTPVSTNATYSFTAIENRTLLANFTINSYSIAASVLPANSGTIAGTGNYNYGASVSLTATSETGYAFIDWTENGTQVSTDVTYSFTITGNRILIANFTTNSYSIAASVLPENSGTIAGTGNYNYGTTGLLIATPETGYVFKDWTENDTPVSTNATYSFTITENKTFVANFEITSAISEISKNDQIHIYPNPTTGLINIKDDELKITNIQITDNLGQAIQSFSNSQTIDISHLQNGIYFIRIQTKNNVYIEKIIKF